MHVIYTVAHNGHYIKKGQLHIKRCNLYKQKMLLQIKKMLPQIKKKPNTNTNFPSVIR